MPVTLSLNSTGDDCPARWFPLVVRCPYENKIVFQLFFRCFFFFKIHQFFHLLFQHFYVTFLVYLLGFRNTSFAILTTAHFEKTMTLKPSWVLLPTIYLILFIWFSAAFYLYSRMFVFWSFIFFSIVFLNFQVYSYNA